jgi:hypothetical protein
MKKIILLLFIAVQFSCSKDDDATTATSTDFKSILTNNSSKEWIINDCMSPYYYPTPLITRTIWTFKNDNTGNIAYYTTLVQSNFTWSYNEDTKILRYTDSKSNKVTSVYVIDFNADAINASKFETFSGANFVSSFSTAEVGCTVGFIKK